MKMKRKEKRLLEKCYKNGKNRVRFVGKIELEKK